MTRYKPADLARVAEEAAATPGRLEMLESQWRQDVAKLWPETDVASEPPPPTDDWEAAVQMFRNENAQYRDADLGQDPDAWAAFQQYLTKIRFSNLTD